MGKRRRKETGIALILVMVFLAIMTIIVVELLFTSRINYRLTTNFCDSMKAEVLAHSGVRLSILRLKIYMKILKLAQNMPKNMIRDDILNMIWGMPMPSYPWGGAIAEEGEEGEDNEENAGGDDLSFHDNNVIEKTRKTTRVEGIFYSTISGEGGKININMLDGDKKRGSSKKIKKAIKKELMKLMQSRRRAEEEKGNYAARDALSPKTLIDNIEKFITKDKTDSYESSRGFDSGEGENVPPKGDRFYTLQELHLVDGWEDDLYNQYSSFLTVYSNMGAININTMDAEMIRALDENFTEEDVQAILEQRNKQLFASDKKFINWVRANTSAGDRFNRDGAFMFTTREKSFIVESTGEYNGIKHTIKVAVQLYSKKELEDSRNSNNTRNSPKPGTGSKGGSGNGNNTAGGKKDKKKKYPLDTMKIVYWYEE